MLSSGTFSASAFGGPNQWVFADSNHNGSLTDELAKVVWPSRIETVRYTITVILFSVGTALILGLADYGFLKAFEGLLK